MLGFIQKTAGWVFGAAFLARVGFWLDKGLKPSGHATLFVLYCVLGASALIWCPATALKWQASRSESKASPAVDQSVRSYNQSGGITARNVTVGSPNRQSEANEPKGGSD